MIKNREKFFGGGRVDKNIFKNKKNKKYLNK
jgi:hypothetical protein